LNTVVRVKNNKNDSVREIRKQVNKSDEREIWTNIQGYENVKVYEGHFDMKNVEKPIRVISF
jgi:hypothetical protein